MMCCHICEECLFLYLLLIRNDFENKNRTRNMQSHQIEL